MKYSDSKGRNRKTIKTEHTNLNKMDHILLYIPFSAAQQYVLDMLLWKKKKKDVVTTLRDREIISDA